MEINGLLLDIDGVLHVGGNPVHGAREVIELLRDRGISFCCISNTTRSTRSMIAARLAGIGINVPAEAILTPASAAAAVLTRRRIDHAMLLTTTYLHDEFAASGIVNSGGIPAAVVIGDAGDRFTYAAMNRAFRSVMAGAVFLALEKDRYWMDEEGLSLSAGPFVHAVEYASGREAELIGKPSASFFAAALALLGTPATRTLMVGDDIRTDIGGAIAAGMRAALVQTGKYREDLVASSGITPDIVLSSIADLPALLE